MWSAPYALCPSTFCNLVFQSLSPWAAPPACSMNDVLIHSLPQTSVSTCSKQTAGLTLKWKAQLHSFNGKCSSFAPTSPSLCSLTFCHHSFTFYHRLCTYCHRPLPSTIAYSCIVLSPPYIVWSHLLSPLFTCGTLLTFHYQCMPPFIRFCLHSLTFSYILFSFTHFTLLSESTCPLLWLPLSFSN